jgi:hypothetical protein
VLIGYGAHAICPYLAYETARQWRTSSRTVSLIKTGKVPDVSIQQAQVRGRRGRFGGEAAGRGPAAAAEGPVDGAGTPAAPKRHATALDPQPDPRPHPNRPHP